MSAWFGIFLLSLIRACRISEEGTRDMLVAASGKCYDVVVVPGVPLENGTWSPVMKARIYWSKYLYDHGLARNIMYSGGAVYTPYIEADVMARYAEALGIPREHILTETLAQHSTENIYYSYKKARKLRYQTVALATDPFQTGLLRRFVRLRVSDQVGFIPIVFDTIKAMEAVMVDPIIDFSGQEVSHFVPITERTSFWERFQGTMGRRIDRVAYN